MKLETEEEAEKLTVVRNLTIHSDRYLVAATTVWSGASYVYSKDAVKILNEEEREEKSKRKED